ncbi:hypothetical protein EON63_20050 [archaeon]|nr:MAG: hypothetical protein EON63_20050 [archaeon]
MQVYKTNIFPYPYPYPYPLTLGEVLIHGHPSGLDNTTSCFGGMVKFRKLAEGNDFQIMDQVPVLDILLTNTKVPR